MSAMSNLERELAPLKLSPNSVGNLVRVVAELKIFETEGKKKMRTPAEEGKDWNALAALVQKLTNQIRNLSSPDYVAIDALLRDSIISGAAVSL